MKVKYQLPALTYEERVLLEYILLDEIEKQSWYAILFLEIWQTEGLICIQ
ncbi:MAG: hypothetical protein HYR76_07375 [Ignavibacteria bacterium]|nr:hypothetical protein [Ignavibacteria bacterium]MBI3766188.1 hypothetical protein [Ignavibacteriales bacterium]